MRRERDALKRERDDSSRNKRENQLRIDQVIQSIQVAIQVVSPSNHSVLMYGGERRGLTRRNWK